MVNCRRQGAASCGFREQRSSVDERTPSSTDKAPFVMKVNSRDLHFYHGTGAKAAISILSDGARNAMDELGWRSLASELWAALREIGSEQELLRRFVQHEDLLHTPGLTPLRSADHREDGHRFVYGHFFATLNIGHAYRYAVRNPVRSEFLHAISAGLKLLERNNASLSATTIANRHPAILQLIAAPPPPVVIELTGIDEERLSNEDGGKPAAPQIELYLEMAREPGVDAPASFRIDNVTRRDVVAVHDLSCWAADDILPPPWTPDSAAIAIVRKEPQQWLSNQSR
jgi:hypothetical protein